MARSSFHRNDGFVPDSNLSKLRLERSSRQKPRCEWHSGASREVARREWQAVGLPSLQPRTSACPAAGESPAHRAARDSACASPQQASVADLGREALSDDAERWGANLEARRAEDHGPCRAALVSRRPGSQAAEPAATSPAEDCAAAFCCHGERLAKPQLPPHQQRPKPEVISLGCRLHAHRRTHAAAVRVPLPSLALLPCPL